MRKTGSVRDGGGAAAAGANVPGSLEQDVALECYPRIAAVGAAAFQRDELPLNQCLNIGAVQVIGFCAVVDEKQDGKFMGTQHSWLQLVC